MRKIYKYALWAVGCAWGVAMIALSPQFVAAHRESKNALQAFDQYSSSLVNQKYVEAYSYCGSDFRAALTYDQFVNLQRSLESRFGAIKLIRRSAYYVHGSGKPTQWTATVDADIVYEKQALRFQFAFHKEGDRWVLFGAQQL